MNTDITYCGVTHPVEKCKDCKRNIRLVEFPADTILSMTMFNPSVMNNTCDGYIKKKEDNEVCS